MVFVIREVFGIKILDELEELLILLLNIVYNIIMVASKLQGTIGKMFFDVVIVNEDMQRLSLSQSFVRCMAYYFSYITLGIGFIMVVFNEKHRALHDRVADTYVIYKYQ